LARERKHLFHFGIDARERQIITLVAEREGVSLAEATRRIIRSCVVGDQLIVTPTPPPPKKRRAKATPAGAESNAH
jgi:hypothetical protein